MNIIVQSKSVPVTAALRRFIERQALKVVRKGRRVTSIFVFLETVARKKNESDAAEVKFLINAPGKTMCIQRQGHDLYEVIVDTANRASRSVRKLKERRIDSYRHKVSPDMYSFG